MFEKTDLQALLKSPDEEVRQKAARLLDRLREQEPEQPEPNFNVDAFERMEAQSLKPTPLVQPTPVPVDLHIQCEANLTRIVREKDVTFTSLNATIAQRDARIKELEALVESVKDIAEQSLKTRLSTANSSWTMNDANVREIRRMEKELDTLRTTRLGRKPLYEEIVTEEQQKNLAKAKKSRDEFRQSLYSQKLDGISYIGCDGRPNGL